MIARGFVIVGALALFGCRDIAGVKPITYSDAGSSGCNTPTPRTLFDGPVEYDVIYASGGFVYLESLGGVDRCPEADCTGGPTKIAAPDASSSFESSVLAGSTIDYSVLGAADKGDLHSVGLDGTGDQVILAGAETPYWLAVSGSRLFWTDDAYNEGSASGVDSVACLGCSGPGSTPWIDSGAFAGGIYALVADANNVYVLADDASAAFHSLLSCPVSAPCGATPKKLLGNLDYTMTSTQIAIDGTYVYLAREDHSDVVRVDASGNMLQVVTSQDVTAIAVDAAAGNLYFATASGAINRVSTAGGALTTLTCVADTVYTIAVDDAVYFVAGALGGTVYSIAK